MAQHAEQIFDELGEAAMTHFLYHALQTPSTDTLWQNAITATLSDRSFVSLVQDNHDKNQYLFNWLDDDQLPHVKVRPATNIETTPAPEPSHHLMQWPTTEDIQRYALTRATAQAAQVVNPDSDPHDFHVFDLEIRHLAIMDTFAPELRKAANHEILNESCPQNAIDVVESYLDDYAEDAIARVPPQQWQALVDHLAQEMGQA